jgi:hypothetical protein
LRKAKIDAIDKVDRLVADTRTRGPTRAIPLKATRWASCLSGAKWA